MPRVSPGVHGRGPNQLQAFTEFGYLLAASVLKLDDRNPLPIGVFTRVKGVTLKRAVGLLFDVQPHT
jgi:hypothetical protein